MQSYSHIYMLDMESFELEFLPTPSQRVHGNAEKKCQLEGKWRVLTNCPSERWQNACRKFFQQFHSLKASFQFEGISLFEKTDKNLSEIYPFGFISPRSPLFLTLSPSEIHISPQVILSQIKWQTEWNLTHPQCTEEYQLLICPFIQISSRSERGLYYGLKTLAQMVLQNKGELAYQTIQDSPALAMRALHFDFKAFRPTLDFVLWQIEMIASYKINTVVIEWEDKYPFEGDLAFIRHPAAFSQNEVQRILSTCHQNYIEVIPLIQSLAHFEYVFKHSNWQELAEKPNAFKKPFLMFCPSNPKSLNAILQIHDQILAGLSMHSSSKYIHLGLDEAYHLGSCAKCQKRLNANSSEGKSRIFIEWVNTIAQHYLSHGKTPIIWHDMLVRHPELITQLNPQIIICDWEYEQPLPSISPARQRMDPKGESVDWVRTWDKKTVKNLQDSPPDTMKYFLDSCWQNKSGKYAFHTFPYTRYFKSKGFQVVIAPATQFGHSTPGGPRYYIHIPNITYANITAAKQDCIGSFCTNWAIRESPWPLLQFGFLLHAETSWTGKEIPEDILFAKMIHLFYGIPLTKETQSFLPKLEGFFSTTSVFGEKLPLLLKNLDEKNQESNIYFTQNELLTTLPLKIQQYSLVFDQLAHLVELQQGNFEFLQTMFHYWAFISQFVLCIHELEEYAIALDSDQQMRQKTISWFETQKKRLQQFETQWHSLHRALEQQACTYLEPSEIPIYLQEILTPITKILALYPEKFAIMTESLTDFTESVIDHIIKRQ